MRPLLAWVNAVANRLVAASGVTPVDRAAVGGQDVDTIRHLVEHSASVGALNASFRTQLSGVLDLEKLTVGDLVVPDSRPTAVPVTATVADVQAAATRSGHLRILVDGFGAAPGVIHVRDTLLEQPERPVRDLTRPSPTMEAHTPIYEALAKMRLTSQQLSAVMRDGRFVGVITVSDILRRVLPTDFADR